MRGRTISSVVRSSATAWNAPSEKHSASRRQPARLRDGRIVRAVERIWVRVERHLGITRALVPRRQPEIPTRQRDAPAASAEGTAPAGRYDVADGDLAQLEEVGRHDVGDGLLASPHLDLDRIALRAGGLPGVGVDPVPDRADGADQIVSTLVVQIGEQPQVAE